ncbi:MAG: SCP2 sterol-binding domain-containing protein [Myxococcota bacterium]
MKELLDLPRNVMPAEFVAKVRELVADEPAPPGASDDKAVFTLVGPGGGAWNAGFEESGLVIGDGAVDSPSVQITMSVADWREFVAGRVRDAVKDQLDTTLLDPRALGLIYEDPQKVERLRQFSGDIQIIVEDREDDADYTMTVTLGGDTPSVDEPTTTVRISMEDLVALAKGGENLQEAFFAGRIRLDGDMNLAMALMTALMEGRHDRT